MKSKNMTLMVVAIGCGLVAAFLTARLSGNSGPEMVDIWVAKKEITVGSTLDEKEFENLVVRSQMPKASLPPDIITNVEDLKGKRVNRTLRPGNYFAPSDVGADSGIKLPEGMRQYAIRADVVRGAGGFVEAGKKVDVLLTESIPNGKRKTGVILQNMLVLTVDQHARPNEGPQAGRQQLTSVSLAVTPKQGMILSTAEGRGEVKLMLRDEKSTDIKDDLVVEKIPGFDEDAKQIAARRVSIVVAKADVPLNTFITDDNIDQFFKTQEVTEDMLVDKSVKDIASVKRKFISRPLEADQQVFRTMLSEKEVDQPTKVVVKEVQKMGDQPNMEPSDYPRKFVQIINNQRVWFLETSPGEFRKLEGESADLKNIPTTSGASDEKKEEKKPAKKGDRAA